jgi:hypothetical protein
VAQNGIQQPKSGEILGKLLSSPSSRSIIMGKLLVIMIRPNRSRRSPTVDIIEKSPGIVIVSFIIWFDWINLADKTQQ